MRGRRRRKLILTLAKLMIISTRRQGQARILSLRNLTDRCQKFTILVTPSGQAGWRDCWPNFTLERSESGQERIAHWPSTGRLAEEMTRQEFADKIESNVEFSRYLLFWR